MSMKSSIFLVLLSSFCFIAHAQPGFNKKYDFGSAASFHNVILKGDTLITVGSIWDIEAQQQGLIFAKMDTLGNVLNSSSYFDILGSHLAFQKGYPIIQSDNGNYLMMGDILDRESDFLLTMSPNGEVLFFWEYPYESNIRTSHPWKLIAMDNGYLILSKKQLDNFNSDIFVTKINEEGAILWEQSYGDYERSEGLKDVWVSEDKNTFVIGCFRATSTPLSPTPNFKCGQSWIFAIDSLGALKWEWAGEPCEEGGVGGLQHTDDNGWIYLTLSVKAFDQWIWGFAPKIVKRDGDFDFLWERELAESYWTETRITDLHPTSDGNWIGAGKWLLPAPIYGYSDSYIYETGCLFSYSNQGDSLWTRCDTIILENGHVTSHFEYGNFVILPSGSIIAAGSFQESLGGGVGKTWAWLVKVNKNGCMDAPCITTELEVLPTKEKKLSIFPNPAQGQVFFEIPKQGLPKSSYILITDITGKLIWRQLIKEEVQKVVWNTATTSNGIYFYQWIEAGRMKDSGKVIIQK